MFYTYAYLRKDGTPYYIGKGQGDRWKSKHRKGIIKVPPAERVLFLKENLTEAQAFAHERYMISVLGRKDLGTGCLRNLTDGGEGVSGMRHSRKTKELIRRITTGVKQSQETVNKRVSKNKGQKRTEETKSKISSSSSGKVNYTFMSPSGIIYKCTTLKTFAEEHGLCRKNLCAVAKGHHKHHKGWTLIQ
ncbi:hypothetical protein [Synechococcus phage S-N03]|uniref:Nuclease associated modular domain-containing protein n=1 Tax=Synechococcus phage S-N03 TaxID=2718943 RepID=A0A6G8R645_9CAUD|nr:hypothetical protein PQC09_gp201 [Synechococcus phage S-N03]QIN96866.1 hypothetical protein [Synechococcus phage S-N03]